MDPKSGSQDGAVHDQRKRTKLRSSVQDTLDERGIIGTTTLGYIAIEFGARLTYDDDVRIRVSYWSGHHR